MTLTPPAHLSPSSISTFQQCPLRFKFNKIDGLTEPPTQHTLLGNFVHEILESVYLMPAESRTLESARIIAKEKWDSSFADGAKSLRVNERDFRWKAWWCVENLWKVEDPKTVELSGIEHQVLGDCDGVTVKGFIDRFETLQDGTLLIGDYKTGKVPYANFLSDKFTQLYIYAVMLDTMGVGKASKVSLIYLASPEVFTREVSSEAIHETKVLLRSTHEKITRCCESEEFEAKPSKLCNWCHFKKICPAWVK